MEKMWRNNINNSGTKIKSSHELRNIIKSDCLWKTTMRMIAGSFPWEFFFLQVSSSAEQHVQESKHNTHKEIKGRLQTLQDLNHSSGF